MSIKKESEPGNNVVTIGVASLSRKYRRPIVSVTETHERSVRRRDYIQPDIAETVDFKDIIDCNRRKVDKEKLVLFRRKPLTSEDALSLELTNPESHRVITYGQKEPERGDFSRWLLEFGVDASAHSLMEKSKRKHIDFDPLDSSSNDRKNRRKYRHHESPTAVVPLSVNRHLYTDVLSRNAPGRAGDHRSLLMAGSVKQFRPQLQAGAVSWSDNYDIVLASTTTTVAGSSSSSSSNRSQFDLPVARYDEPFRLAPAPLRDIVTANRHLLDPNRSGLVPGYAHQTIKDTNKSTGRLRRTPADDSELATFDAAARQIQLPESGFTSNTSSTSSSNRNGNVRREVRSTVDEDLAGTQHVMDQYDLQQQALTHALARHFEGIADAALLMVLQNLQSFVHTVTATVNGNVAGQSIEKTEQGESTIRPTVRLNWEHVLCAVQDQADDLFVKDIAALRVTTLTAFFDRHAPSLISLQHHVIDLCLLSLVFHRCIQNCQTCVSRQK